MYKVLCKLFSFIIITIILSSIVSTSYAHNFNPIGNSKWVFGKKNAQIDLVVPTLLMNGIKAIGDSYTNIDLCNDKQLQGISSEILKPYIDKKLTVWVNGKKYPINTGALKREDMGSTYYDLHLSINYSDTLLKKSGNSFKIDYELFFDETNDTHINLGFISSTEAPDNVTEKDFTSDSRIWEGSLAFGGIETTIKNRDSFLSAILRFLVLGIKHILSGYDHILFLLALIVIGLSFKDVLRIISSFTVAHSITLFLAALNIIRLNSRFVESVIALSICYVALENILRKKSDKRWLVAFSFGLIHGFGFASILQDLEISKSSLIASVLSFNIGVELGQLTIFLTMLPILGFLKSRMSFRKVTVGASTLIFVIGFSWLIERVFNIKFLWF